MSEQNEKLAKVRNSIKSVAKVIQVLSIIARVCIIISIVAVVALAAYKDRLNPLLLEAHQNQELTIETEGEFHFGILSVDADFEQMIAEGEYVLPMIFVLSAVAGVLLINLLIMVQMRKCFKVIEESESPFSRNILQYFRRIFLLAAVMVFLCTDGEVISTITIIAIFVCIYKMIDYGITLQEEINETL